MPAVLHVNIDFYLSMYRSVASMPIRAGARFSMASKSARVLDVRTERDGTTILLRETDRYEGYTWFEDYLLRNTARRQAVFPSTIDSPGWFGGASQATSLFMPVSARLPVFWRRLVVDWRRAEISSSADWLAGAELVAIERQTAGYGTKTIEFPLNINRQ